MSYFANFPILRPSACALCSATTHTHTQTQAALRSLLQVLWVRCTSARKLSLLIGLKNKNAFTRPTAALLQVGSHHLSSIKHAEMRQMVFGGLMGHSEYPTTSSARLAPLRRVQASLVDVL